MTLVVDTNVIISAIIKPVGYEAKLRQLWLRGGIKIAVSEPILQEVERVLAYPHIQTIHQWSLTRIKRHTQKLRTKAIVVPATTVINVVKEDPSDNKFLSCAIEAKAKAIISGDKHLKRLGSFRGIPIVTARTFIENLESQVA